MTHGHGAWTRTQHRASKRHGHMDTTNSLKKKKKTQGHGDINMCVFMHALYIMYMDVCNHHIFYLKQQEGNLFNDLKYIF